jgi:hypothetical protein
MRVVNVDRSVPQITDFVDEALDNHGEGLNSSNAKKIIDYFADQITIAHGRTEGDNWRKSEILKFNKISAILGYGYKL